MLERVKVVLVESLVGAIALGYLLAEVILHFVNIFVLPIAGWVTRSEFQDITARTQTSAGIPIQNALPELMRFLLLLLVWYLLLRWLYFKPLRNQKTEPVPDQK